MDIQISAFIYFLCNIANILYRQYTEIARTVASASACPWYIVLTLGVGALAGTLPPSQARRYSTKAASLAWGGGLLHLTTPMVQCKCRVDHYKASVQFSSVQFRRLRYQHLEQKTVPTKLKFR